MHVVTWLSQLSVLLGTHDNHKVTLNGVRAWHALVDDFRSPNDASKQSVILLVNITRKLANHKWSFIIFCFIHH